MEKLKFNTEAIELSEFLGLSNEEYMSIESALNSIFNDMQKGGLDSIGDVFIRLNDLELPRVVLIGMLGNLISAYYFQKRTGITSTEEMRELIEKMQNEN